MPIPEDGHPACCDAAMEHLDWFIGWADDATVSGPPPSGWAIDRDGAPILCFFTFCPFCGTKLPTED